MAMEVEKEAEVDSTRRRVHESPYVRAEDGEFVPVEPEKLPSEPLGVKTFGESVQKLHMKCPGEVIGVGKMEHEVAKLRAELRSKSAVQLKEAVARQSKVLGNKALVSRLPDKGEKCRLSLGVMRQLLAERTKEEELEVGMEKMKISTEKMEWKNRLLDSDDDSDPEKDPEDPLAVLAQGLVPHTSSRARSREANNGTAHGDDDNLEGRPNYGGGQQEVEKFATEQASRVDLKSTPQNRFVPHASLKQMVLDPELRQRLGGPDSSPSLTKPSSSPSPKPGTPSMPLPPTYTSSTCLLSLGDSLRLQQEQEKRVREAQVIAAQSRLTASKGLLVGEPVVEGARFTEYRTAAELSGDDEDVSDDEGVGVVGVVGKPVEEE